MFEIDQLFIDSFIVADFGLPIAHENRDYKPNSKEAYAELIVLQNDVTAWTVADADQSDGVFRIILRYPSGEGTGRIKSKADQIIEEYKIHSKITYVDHTVEITSVNRSVGVQETGWYKMIIDIRYKTFFGR